VFGDGRGGCWALGERDCSAQRRSQKVLEETPAPDLPKGTRAGMLAAAERLCSSVSYRGAGTVEFLYDAASSAAENASASFTFLEVNARLQVGGLGVDHGVCPASS
jgi:urea carboxylase